ncbi:MAG TPA: hypothetical protein VF588_11125 [Pyrinomonadaceae bacterium]|jgi:hypothetical protein
MRLTKTKRVLAAVLAAVFVSVCLPGRPALSQNVRGRLINEFEGAVAGRMVRRANTATAQSVAVSLERSTARALSRRISEAAAARGTLAKNLPRVADGLSLRGTRAGKISVASGSLTRRKPISLVKTPAATAASGRSGAKTAAGLRDAGAQEAGNAELLKRQYGQNLSPEARKITGGAIYQAEQNAAAATTRSQKALALERQQFYKRQQELGRLTAANAAKKAATTAAGGGARGRAIRQRIGVGQERLQYINDKHVDGGKFSANKSVFNKGEDIEQLVRQAETVPPAVQAHGTSQRIVNAGRNIGIDRATGKQTPMYTVITKAGANLHNAFPGLPERIGMPDY